MYFSQQLMSLKIYCNPVACHVFFFIISLIFTYSFCRSMSLTQDGKVQIAIITLECTRIYLQLLWYNLHCEYMLLLSVDIKSCFDL